MLLGGKQSELKQIAVMTRNPQFNRLLSSILSDWKFFAVEDPSQAKVAFVERGLDFPNQEAQIVWLSPMPLAEGYFLTTPISLTELYLLLEARFFPTPRRNIRVPMEKSIDIKVENYWLEGQLVSLSDRGGRITCSSEIPKGKAVNIEVKLAGEMFRIPSEVLYCIPAGDSPGRLHPQIGVIFKPSQDGLIDMLRRYIEKCCIQSACAREDIAINDPCVSWIDVPDRLRVF